MTQCATRPEILGAIVVRYRLYLSLRLEGSPVKVGPKNASGEQETADRQFGIPL